MNDLPKFNPDEIDPESGLTLGELQQEQRRREAVAEANADPLPGPLALAFPAGEIRVGAFAIRPVVGIDIALLRHLYSPLLKQMAEARKPKDERAETPFTDEDGWVMALQFLITPEQAEAELKRGPDHFKALARERIGYRMNPIIIGQIVEAVSRQFALAFETAVKFSAQTKSPAENDAFFTRPPAAPRTASAGGSTTSAA